MNRRFRRPWRSPRDRALAAIMAAESAQRKMRPQEVPSIDNFSVAFKCDPARYVGGDLYEYIELPDGRWGIAVGDFSGHGLQAAIQMNFIKGHVLATALEHTVPAEVLCEINADFMRHRNSKQHFVEMVYGILDPHTKIFEFARAGGNIRLFLRRWNTKKEFLHKNEGSFAMGFPVPEERFRAGLVTGRIQLGEGDALFLYTDGIPDARNPEREDDYGDQRLRRVMVETDGLDAGESLDHVFSRVQRFIGGGRQPNDDMTLVIIRADEPPG